MFGISGLVSNTVWLFVFFPLRSFIKSIAENVRWRLGGGGSGGGGGGGGGRVPPGGGGGGSVPVVAAVVKQKRHVKICCPLEDRAVTPTWK